MKNSFLVLTILIVAVILLSNFTTRIESAESFHTPEELALFQGSALNPIGPGEYFLPSESCRGCHGYDTLMQANIDENGMDVNLFDRWESSMMAFSAKDPLWRAKVSHEILTNPAHSLALQTNCTSCHAPMGHYNAIYNGATSYTISDLINDTLGLDGVSCAGCHTISPDAGNTFSGIIPFDTTRQIYGPFPGPFLGPMQLYEGYTPVYSPHMDDSQVCSPCHTLVTQTVDLAGNYTGGEFIEQATYHEYLNSSYPSSNIKCQTCHMPQLADPIIIANGFTALTPRFPFNQHTFSGANHFMLELIKNNKSALDIQVADEKFDSAMAATLRLLQEESVIFELENDSITSDTAYYRVRIKNKAGHKFPSGYPARRAVLQLVMTDAANDTIFRSGTFDSEFRVTLENPQFIPHYDVINQDNQSQIYEMVMGDVNGQFTTLLERAAILLKDNRIPPDGFTTTAPMYDTVMISPDALADPNFNKINSVEGSGEDLVHYRIPITGISGTVKVNARLFYQSVPPKWLDEMFALSSGPIDTFKTMYQGANKQPILISSDSLVNVLSGNPENIHSANAVKVWPSLSMDGRVHISVDGINRILFVEVYNSEGKRVRTMRADPNSSHYSFQLPETKGHYYLSIKTKLNIAYKKVLRL
jgi:hypothetical protein